MTIVKRIDSWSLAKVLAVVCVFVSFFVRVVLWWLVSEDPENHFFENGIEDVFLGLIKSVLFAVMAGLASGLVAGWLYNNFVAPWIGGVKIELSADNTPRPPVN